MSIIVIDTETTGLVKDGVNDFLAQPGICQIAMVRLVDGKGYAVENEFVSFVNPEIAKWEDGAMKVHGLSPDKVADAPTFFELFPKIAAFFVGATSWAGYNTKFDKNVLWFQLMRYGFERSFPWPPGEIDVMELASRRLNGQGKRGQKRWKLVDAYREVFNGDYPGAHDALGDVRATASLLKEWTQ